MPSSTPLVSAEEEADIHARVDFDLALKRAQGNHFSFAELSFQGVQLTRKAEWMPQVCEALVANDTCTLLNLSNTGLDDKALQQLAVVLAVPSRCPKLRTIDLRGNPGLTAVGETVAQGLCRLRPTLEDVLLGKEFDKMSTSFVHDKKLVPGLTAWNPDELRVEGTQQDYYCPREISGDGERIVLTRGFQGTNGTKYRCDLATFEMYHSTGNMVLITLASEENAKEGVVV